MFLRKKQKQTKNEKKTKKKNEKYHHFSVKKMSNNVSFYGEIRKLSTILLKKFILSGDVTKSEKILTIKLIMHGLINSLCNTPQP